MRKGKADNEYMLFKTLATYRLSAIGSILVGSTLRKRSLTWRPNLGLPLIRPVDLGPVSSCRTVNVVAVATAVPSLSVRRFLVTWTCSTWAFGVLASLEGSVDAELSRLREMSDSFSFELEVFSEDKVRLESRSTLGFLFVLTLITSLSTFPICSDDSGSLDSSSKINN